MKLLKSIAIAFTTYSRIPMPIFEWKEEDMRYSMCFFPWVGAVIGGLVWLWFRLAAGLGINTLTYVLIGAAIPLLVTGGIHVDGYMDTMDAFHSYQSRDKKLEILKDSHIGAFSVIMLAVYGLIYLAGFAQITDSRSLMVYCFGFFLARCLSAIGVVSLPTAKKERMLYRFAGSAHGRRVKLLLYIQLLVCCLLMMYISWIRGLAVILAAGISYGYYVYRSRKELGGITGDTAGYFVTICEGAMVLAAAAISTLMHL